MSPVARFASSRTTRLAPRRPLAPVFAGALALASAVAIGVAAAPAAHADEIRYLDATTCAPMTKQVFEITEETWLQVSYREKSGGKIERIDSRLVLDVKRAAEDAQTNSLRSGLTELAARNWAGARQHFGNAAHGGRTQDPTTLKFEYKPFAPEPGKGKWTTEYGLYYYALASYEEGVQSGDAQLLSDALQALDADTAGEKGFLVRFREGKSRWYGDAWLLKGKVLLALKKFDEAGATLDALYQKSLTTPIGVRFAYEAKMGPGKIAEGKGDLNAAEAAFEAGVSAIQTLFDQPIDACGRAELGRWYSEARMQKARILRLTAEKSKSAADYGRLRTYLQSGTPEELRKKFAGKPSEVVDAALAGALSPSVQAVAQNGIGMAYYEEKRYTDAIAAFTAVRVKYFASAADEVPRALYHLAYAADAAAAAAKGDAKTMYTAQAESARQELSSPRWKASPWASKKGPP